MECNCKTEWKGDYNHSSECAKKRVEWWLAGISSIGKA